MISCLWTLNIEFWPLGLVRMIRWIVDKRHVGTHGSCVRSNALVCLPSIPLNKWSVTHKPHRGFVVYRAVLACDANAVTGRVMRKQRHRCCVVFRFECLHGVFGAWKHASIKITQHRWRCFRAHSADRVASLRSATLPCKERNRDAVCCYWRRGVASHLLHKRWNRDAVCCSKRSCLALLFIE